MTHSRQLLILYKFFQNLFFPKNIEPNTICTLFKGESPESKIELSAFKNDKQSCILEIKSAKAGKHDGNWKCHLADSDKNESHKDEAFVDVNVRSIQVDLFIWN